MFESVKMLVKTGVEDTAFHSGSNRHVVNQDRQRRQISQQVLVLMRQSDASGSDSKMSMLSSDDQMNGTS